MSAVIVLFLFAFEIAILLPKLLHVRPVWVQLLCHLGKVASDLPSHEELCWSEIAPRKRGGSVS